MHVPSQSDKTLPTTNSLFFGVVREARDLDNRYTTVRFNPARAMGIIAIRKYIGCVKTCRLPTDHRRGALNHACNSLSCAPYLSYNSSRVDVRPPGTSPCSTLLRMYSRSASHACISRLNG